jgi:predicted DNA binding CopG/RHH family protein
MTNTPNSSDDAELWESGQLGASEEHVRTVSPEKTKEIQDALGLQPVTVRLQKELVEQLKVMAKKEGLGYQPFIRHILTRYVRDTVSAESKRESA